MRRGDGPALPEPAFEAAVLTDTGTERPDNQDFALHEKTGRDGVLVVVADGVSSQAGGAIASQLAVKTTVQVYQEQPVHLSPLKRLSKAVQQANMAVYDLGVVVTELRGMGTTLTAVAIEGGELAAAHVGDSRLYLVREGSSTQLTKDHTVTGERVRLGLLSKTRARHHPDRSTLTRCVGRELIVAFDRFTRRIRAGDTFVLCSDGLWNTLEESEIARIVTGRDTGACCQDLIDAANRMGTLDNVTVGVVRAAGARPEPVAKETLYRRLRRVVGGRRE